MRSFKLRIIKEIFRKIPPLSGVTQYPIFSIRKKENFILVGRNLLL